MDLQCCASFGWISYTYTHIHSSSGSFPVDVIAECWGKQQLLVSYPCYPQQYVCINPSLPVTLFFWAPKSLQMVTAAMKLEDTYSLEEKL